MWGNYLGKKLEEYKKSLKNKNLIKYKKWHDYFLNNFANIRGNVLDIGCGCFPYYYRNWVESKK